jgi:hypothetical protein
MPCEIHDAPTDEGADDCEACELHARLAAASKTIEVLQRRADVMRRALNRIEELAGDRFVRELAGDALNEAFTGT